MLRFGTLKASKKRDDDESHESTPSGAGGGIIVLHSFGDIVNEGALSSREIGDIQFEGGTIALCANGVVMNRGDIDCGRSGRIMIQCREFVNDGAISAETNIMISNGSDRRETEIVMMAWNGCNLKEIPLSVHKHREHHENKDMYHPQNLLDKKGTETEYRSPFMKPAVGDWIIFKIENESTVIHKTVIIRNNEYGGYGLKCIELSLGLESDGDAFDVLSVIPQIPKDNKKEQYFEIKNEMMSNASIWMKQYKFIKLRVLENWGDTYCNRFYSFSVLGFECESDELLDCDEQMLPSMI